MPMNWKAANWTIANPGRWRELGSEHGSHRQRSQFDSALAKEPSPPHQRLSSRCVHASRSVLIRRMHAYSLVNVSSRSEGLEQRWCTRPTESDSCLAATIAVALSCRLQSPRIDPTIGDALLLLIHQRHQFGMFIRCGKRLRTVRKAKFNRCSSLDPPSVKMRRASPRAASIETVSFMPSALAMVCLLEFDARKQRYRQAYQTFARKDRVLFGGATCRPLGDNVLTSFIDPRERSIASRRHEQKCRRRWHHRTPTDFGIEQSRSR